jgi:hypothetical protein
VCHALQAEIEERQVIQQLIDFSESLLKKFNQQTKVQTQRVVVDFLKTAVQKGVEKNAELKI